MIGSRMSQIKSEPGLGQAIHHLADILVTLHALGCVLSEDVHVPEVPLKTGTESNTCSADSLMDQVNSRGALLSSEARRKLQLVTKIEIERYLSSFGRLHCLRGRVV